MKFNRYLQKSLSRRFLFLMGGFIVFFVIGAFILLVTFHSMNQSNSTERNVLNKKEKIAQEIKDDFDQAFFNVRGYLAFGDQTMRDDAIAQGPKITNLEKQYKKMATSEDDKEFLNDIIDFTDVYFKDTLPKIISDYELGDKLEAVKKVNKEVTPKILGFQKTVKKDLQTQDQNLENHYQKLINNETYIQLGFILFFLLLMVILFFMMNYMFRKIGQPLAHLAEAANEIANGNESSEYLGSTREDELGTLSASFQRMVEKVQEKERDLLAQNEELIAQQDELQVQQTELENAIELHKENEEKLKKRNKLVNQISNTLNKQEVLDSIVSNMCEIIEADKGIIADMNDHTHAAFRVGEPGVGQFLSLLKNGLYDHLVHTKEPFTIRRELELNEKGYHEGVYYGHDLHLPVLSSDEEVIAVMVFTRYGGTFHAEQMEEFKALSRSIGISLEKISLFQKSEEERKRNQDILNTLQEGVQFVDVHGQTLQVNDYLCEMYHCKIKNLVGAPFEEWIVKLQESVKENEFSGFIKESLDGTGSDAINQFIYTMKDPFRVIKIYSKDLFQNQEKTGTVFVHLDITKEFEVDQMKSEFVSTVSHELRTPLSSVLGFTELMLNRELKPDRQKKYLTTIYHEAKRLTSLINDFLDVQRMESGRQAYEKKYIQLLPVLNKVIDAQRVTTTRHEFILDCSLENPAILGDRAKIEQVFANLINNAVKYSPNGGLIKVKVTEENQHVQVSVIDQGLGIPQDAIDHLFQKFYRVDNSDRRSIGGTGLGLSIVQEILKEHDGKVDVQSFFGKGSTFTVTFPAVQIEEEEQAQDTEKDSASKYHIVVIEDDLNLTELIKQELRENGFLVKSFSTARESLQYLEKTIPDAIVLDILLEDDHIDGWEIIRRLKDSQRQRNIPIIVSTALDEKEKSFSLGAQDFLVKPYHPSQLSKSIMHTILKNGKAGQILVPDPNKQE